MLQCGSKGGCKKDRKPVNMVIKDLKTLLYTFVGCSNAHNVSCRVTLLVLRLWFPSKTPHGTPVSYLFIFHMHSRWSTIALWELWEQWTLETSLQSLPKSAARRSTIIQVKLWQIPHLSSMSLLTLQVCAGSQSKQCKSRQSDRAKPKTLIYCVKNWFLSHIILCSTNTGAAWVIMQ